jgi:acyl-CoA synthetase (AMP-forming)/AMP-acid ligase II
VAYGQTEASPRITYLGPGELAAHPDSVGRALPGVEIELLDEDGADVPPGQIGEVVAGGPNIMRGYFASEEHTAEIVDAEGRLHTGDLGRLDADGYLYLCGRKSQMIKTAGERVFPGEIEQAISSHPDVRECVAFGVPDPLLGERVIAHVVADHADLDVQSVRRHCLDQLAYVRTPREIYLVDAIPKTPSEKIDRARVVREYVDGARGTAT